MIARPLWKPIPICVLLEILKDLVDPFLPDFQHETDVLLTFFRQCIRRRQFKLLSNLGHQIANFVNVDPGCIPERYDSFWKGFKKCLADLYERRSPLRRSVKPDMRIPVFDILSKAGVRLVVMAQVPVASQARGIVVYGGYPGHIPIPIVFYDSPILRMAIRACNQGIQRKKPAQKEQKMI